MNIKKKKGEILIIAISLVILLICIILFIAIIQYFQINTLILGIKNDIFHICQNGILAFSEEELAYETYKVDLNELTRVIEKLIYENYMKSSSSIKDISIIDINIFTNVEECINHTNSNEEGPLLHIILEVNFNPVVKLNNNTEKVIMHNDIRISLMKY